MTVREYFRVWRGEENRRALDAGASMGIGCLPGLAYQVHPAMVAFRAVTAAEREHDEHWGRLLRSTESPAFLEIHADVNALRYVGDRPYSRREFGGAR